MRFIAPFVRGRQRGDRRTPVRRGLALALLLAGGWAADAAAQLPDTSSIVNRAVVTYTGGEVSSSAEATARVTVRRTLGVALAPPREGMVFPGGRRVLAHVLENRGDGTDSFTLAVTAPPGWGAALHLDVDGDGALGAGDPRVEAPVRLAAGETAALLLVLDAPADAPEATVEAAVRAASGFNAAVAAEVVNRLTVRHPLALPFVSKTVDRAEAARGDTLVYTIVYGNEGDAPAAGASVADTLPTGVRYVAGSLRLGGEPAAGGDAAVLTRTDGGRDVLRVPVGDLAPGAAGTLAFRATVAPEAAGIGRVDNVAALSSGEAVLHSEPAATRIGAPELALEKVRIGADSVWVGETVAYRIRVSNASRTLAARGVIVTDTLPVELEFVSSSPAVERQGRVVVWRVGQLAPGADASLELTARVVEPQLDAPVVNRAAATASNGPGASAEAAGFHVRAFSGTELELRKSAGVLEAALGEAVPYVLTLRNTGGLPLRDPVVHDRLPEGVRFLRDAVSGVDSVRVEGRDVTFFPTGPLAPGAEHHVRYAVILVSVPNRGAPLANVAVAWAENGAVRSDTVTAWVRPRRGMPLEARSVVGKVWVDVDGNGRQGAGEGGVGRVEVWTAGGERVTTDAEGRLTFPDIRPGTHVFRIDTLSLPAGMRLADPRDAVQRVRTDGWTMPSLSFRLVPREGAAAAAAAETVEIEGTTVAPARTEAVRGEDEGHVFVAGPGVRITAPADGTVIPGNRLYVGVAGEPGATARLYAGERLLGEGELRPDGSFDFVHVELAPGTHRLHVVMRNTWGQERADTVAVHRNGAVARIEALDAAPEVRAEARAPVPVRVRVLDEWDVPVMGPAIVTAEAVGATFDGEDADLSSFGWQVPVGEDGVAVIPLLGGADVGPGELVVTSGKGRVRIPFTVLPTSRGVVATGMAQVGVGAVPDAFGSVSVRGAVGERTAVTVTVDSRRTDADTEFFARGYDPLDETRYPTHGDGSDRRAFGSATQAVSARVEHGTDWIEVGDVETAGFSGSERLGGYRRALTGAAGRLATGPVVWKAFGSVTDQALVQDQLRGDGTSGPYRFGGPMRPGTERLAVEVRARDNAARLVRREELIRFSDYQVDYRTGDVLLQRPLPAADPFGNPVFLVALVERRSGGEREFVGGVRMELDGGRLVGAAERDSVGIAVYGVYDAAGTAAGDGSANLGGAELRFRVAGLDGGAELLRSEHGDSASVAGQARFAWAAPGERVRVDGGWLRVGDGFASTLNPRLRSGLEELRLGTELVLDDASRVRLRHERQRFRAHGVERRTTTAGAERRFGTRRLQLEGGLLNDAMGIGREVSSATGKAVLTLSPRVDLWVEGVNGLNATEETLRRPDQLGMGVGYRLWDGLRLDASRRIVRTHEDSVFTVSGATLRTELPLSAEAWAGLERTEAIGVSHAAVLGWSQRLASAGGWSFHTLLERRVGVDRAPVEDPLRALPFPQQERDRWSAAWGLDFVPPAGPRLRTRFEFHGVEDRSGWRFDVSGDAPMGPSGAVLMRHNWLQDARFAGPGRVPVRRDHSLLGVAYRPVGTDAFNLLAKVEYRHSANPFSGVVLAGTGQEWRGIAATDAVWSPAGGLWLSGRYALRHTVAAPVEGDLRIRSAAHFGGARVERDLFGALRGRLDGRVLGEGVTGTVLWSTAPSLTLGLGGGLEAEGGYRFGDLQDPDFAAYGRNGAFLLLSFRFTEDLGRTVADFWRARIAAEP
jgi:uncharacterized repeat protein (TIGR01451 family)